VETEINAGSTVGLRQVDLVDLWIPVNFCGLVDSVDLLCIVLIVCLGTRCMGIPILREYKRVVDSFQRETTRRLSGELWSEEEKSFEQIVDSAGAHRKN
jgi:hypothetical protein